jgi:hypothetical protein
MAWVLRKDERREEASRVHWLANVWMEDRGFQGEERLCGNIYLL